MAEVLQRTAPVAARFTMRQVEVVAVPFGQVETVADRGGEPYQEAFDPDVEVELLRDTVPALLHHDPRKPFGHVEVTGRDRSGLRAVLHAANTPAGDEALELAAAGVLYPSIGFSCTSHRSGEVVWRTAIVLHEISLVTFQAYQGASVVDVRHQVGTPLLHQAQALISITTNTRRRSG